MLVGQRGLIAVVAVAGGLAAPVAAEAGEATLKYNPCPDGKLKVWGAGGVVWAAADFTKCFSGVNGNTLTVKITRDGYEVASGSDKFKGPILAVDPWSSEAHAATGATFSMMSNYRGCAYVDGRLLDCAAK